MTSPTSDSDAKKVEFLEKINQVIDLCIDNGFYEKIKEIVPDNALSDGDTLRQLRSDKPPETFCLGIAPYPVKQVWMLQDLQGIYPINYSRKTLKLRGRLFRPWSCLIWAKLVRAELHRKNRYPWLGLYEKVTLYLEEKIGLCHCEELSNRSNYLEPMFDITLLNYLMELSAASWGEASLGYAERARTLSNKVLKIEHGEDSNRREDREKYGHPYDRWIWYNRGIAYQHTRRHQDAIGEFSEVIDKFFNKYRDFPDNESVDAYIEFLLNILTGIIQTAEIYIQGQLAYHALTYLDDNKDLKAWLKKGSNEFKNIGIVHNVAKQLEIRIKLLRLEALLRIGYLKESEDIIENLHPVIESNFVNSVQYNEIPEYDPSQPISIFQVRFIERKVFWYREEAIRLLAVIGQKKISDDLKKEQVPGNIKSELKTLIHRINMVKDRYWPFVQCNPQDRNVYFSYGAQLLNIGMKTVIELVKQDHWYWSNEGTKLLIAVLDLYEEYRKFLPDSEHKPQKGAKKLIVLEDLRSDDLFDIVGGLNDFYDNIIFINLYKKSMDAEVSRKVRIVRRVIRHAKGKGYYASVKNDHFQLLRALDKWDQKFGEHQNIEALSRCNRRVKWIPFDSSSEKDCSECLDEKQKKAFEELLTCCDTIKPNDHSDSKNHDENDNKLYRDDYENIMTEAEEHFSKHLKDNSSHLPEKKLLHFVGLQRWNSLTPAQGRSVGGGYFIYHTDDRGKVDLGIAIDPGFDFVRNLFRQGFSIRDIDIILISHAHPDHLWDFESIVQLLYDLSLKKNIGNRYHRINVILTQGVYQRYGHVIENHKLRWFIEPLVIDLHKDPDDKGFSFRENLEEKTEAQPNRWNLILPASFDSEKKNNNSEKKRCEIEQVTIEPTYAYHDDYSRISDSYGFKIIFEKNGKPFRFGYTGDTKWVGDDLYNNKCPVGNGISCETNLDKCERWKNVADQYRDCRALLIHLGSLIDHKNDCNFANYNAKKCVNLIREKNHPYLPGIIRFLKEITKEASDSQTQKLILVGEFGEELRGGIRIDIVKRLKNMLQNKMPILPVDVGLDVLLWEREYQFICALCNKSKSWEKVEYERYGYDEAIFYVCRTCHKAFPNDVRQDRYRKLYDVGRELTVLPNQS